MTGMPRTSCATRSIAGWSGRRCIPAILLGSWAVFFLGGFAAGLLTGGIGDAAQFGASLLVWGVFVRTVVVWHITWSVNSAGASVGLSQLRNRRAEPEQLVRGPDLERRGLAQQSSRRPASAAHGHRWWEIDVVFATVRVLEMVGLATRVCRPEVRARRAIEL